jgi:hypothetical protein
MSDVAELIEIDDSVSVKGNVVIVDFTLVGPKQHPSETRPDLYHPGESGNPAGRPVLISKAYKKRLSDVNPETGKTHAEEIAENVITLAEGQTRLAIQAASEVADRTEGKPRQTVETHIHISLADRISRARQSLNQPRILDITPIAGQLTD